VRTLILGLGNPILSNDAIGLFIAQRLEGRWSGVDVTTTTTVGLALLDLVEGYDKVFLIDACVWQGRHPGKVIKLAKGDGALHLFSSHGLDFFQLLRLGRAFGYKVPDVGGIYGVEIGANVSFGEELSAGLKRRFESITKEIIEDLSRALKADQALAVRFGETPM
jgi:hydrogenase maturation protease